MPRLNIQQNSEEWLLWRQSKITATSCSVIMGSNPWKTELELWEEMLGMRPAIKSNPAMERGTKLEPDARALASELIKIDFEPCVYESDRYPWMAASLDGISNCGSYLLEIKCPNEKTHEMAINDLMPDYYMSQIQHQLAVTNAQICYYFSYRPENVKKYAIIEVRPNQEYIDKIIEKEQAFWVRLCTMQPPEEIWKLKK